MLALVNVFAEAATTDLNQAVAEATAKNPILPVVNEMFWTLVFFAILWALMKFVLLPPVMRTFNERADKLRDDQQAAEAAESARVERLTQYEAGLAGARSEAVKLIEQARSEGDAERRAQVGAAEAEVAAMRASTAEEIAGAKERARADLSGSITDIAVGAAEAVVQKQIDRSAQVRVVEDFVNQAGKN
ncbi:MAG: F0F1 ATP synthase subunit B [Actinomycetes bacterium]